MYHVWLNCGLVYHSKLIKTSHGDWMRIWDFKCRIHVTYVLECLLTLLCRLKKITSRQANWTRRMFTGHWSVFRDIWLTFRKSSLRYHVRNYISCRQLRTKSIRSLGYLQAHRWPLPNDIRIRARHLKDQGLALGDYTLCILIYDHLRVSRDPMIARLIVLTDCMTIRLAT